MRSGSDPISEDPAELDARADEVDHEARWDTFVAVVKMRKVVLNHWSDVIEDAATALFLTEECQREPWTPSDYQLACAGFAETEGWPAVLQAIARAMREQAASDGD